MKLFIALLLSLSFEAFTYHSSIEFISDNISNALGINFPQSAIIVIAFASFVKAVFTSSLVDLNKTKNNLLVILLSMCAVVDCLIVTLFLNADIYAMLVIISELFAAVYRAIEIVCIMSLLFDAICGFVRNFDLSNTNSSGNSSSRGFRVGDKI